MDAQTYFAFQFDRLKRKETSERNVVGADETKDRAALGTLRVSLVTLMEELSDCDLSLQGPESNDSRCAERDRLMALVLEKSSASHATSNLISNESSARHDIAEWECVARATIARNLFMLSVAQVVDALVQSEQLWRQRIWSSEAHAAAQFLAFSSQTKMYLLQHPAYSPSEPYRRADVEQQERQARWILATLCCGLQVAWEEEWERLTYVLARQMDMDFTEGTATLASREMMERCAIVAMGRPAIDELLDDLEERHVAVQHDRQSLATLNEARRELLAQMQDRITNNEDYVLEEKMRLVESILSVQDSLLEEALEFNNDDPSVYYRIWREYDDERSWLLDERTSFQEVMDYRNALLRLRAPGDPIRQYRCGAAVEWLAGAPWATTHREGVPNAVSGWAQYVKDRRACTSVERAEPDIRSAHNDAPLQVLCRSPADDPLDALYHRVMMSLK